MIRIVVFLTVLLLSSLLNAQTPNLLMKGKVIDSKNEALAFVTIISKDTGGNVLELLYTNEQGEYVISCDENSNQIEFSYVGFQTQIVSCLVNDNVVINLKEETDLLDEVVIAVKKPTIKREIDRLVFNVQNTPLASTNAWDIVKQTPGVNAIGDNLSIRGSQSILVTINDKKVMLTGDALKQMLEGTDGSLVESVEVITNPPAKYEAQGNAVLNIKLKKNHLLGYKGSISDRFKQTTYAYNTLSTQHTYTKEKFNLSGSYSFGNGNTVRYNEDNVHYESGERWNSVMTRKNKIKGRHSFQVETDIKIDTTLTLTIGANGYINQLTKGDYVIPTLIYNIDNVVESNYTTFNQKRDDMQSYTSYFMLDKKFDSSKNLLWSSYFTYDNQFENQDVLTKLNFKNQQPSNSFFATKDKQRTRLAVSGLDYTVDNETSKWELGAKYSIVDAVYGVNFYEETANQIIHNAAKSNLFNYQEINWAGYTSYSKQWKKWQVKAGLRGEYTNIQTKSSNDDNHLQSYFKLFPTAYIKYDLTDEQQFSFSYGKRIDRPSYSWMNPAKSYYNLFSYFQGSSDLKASISHNLNLNYNFRELNFELFYTREINPSMEISYQDNATNQLIYNFTNIDKRQLLGALTTYSHQILPIWSINTFLYAQQQDDYFYGQDKKLYKNDAFVFGGRVGTTIDIDKESNWKAMLTYNFYTPTVQGSFKITGYQRTDFITTREFANKKWLVSLYIYNIFGSDWQTISTKYADQYSYFRDYADTQGFAIGLKYNIGNQKVKYSTKEIDMQEKNRL